MNLDKKLAKYARELENPKHYPKILDILEKAEKTGYKFQDFNIYDLHHITGEMCAYYDAVETPEEDERNIKHCNTNWFIVSDKKLIFFETDSFWIAIRNYFKFLNMLCITKLGQLFCMDRIITTENVDNKIYLLRGAINVCKKIGCDFWNLEEHRILL